LSLGCSELIIVDFTLSEHQNILHAMTLLAHQACRMQLGMHKACDASVVQAFIQQQQCQASGK